jgi:hypothetical protein
MAKVSAIFCDIDGVASRKFVSPNYDSFGAPNENMLRVLAILSRECEIVFVTGRWAVGQAKVEEFIREILPGARTRVFCKPQDYPGTTADYKLAKAKELEAAGYEFLIAFDDNNAVAGLLHNHGLLTAQVLSD